ERQPHLAGLAAGDHHAALVDDRDLRAEQLGGLLRYRLGDPFELPDHHRHEDAPLETIRSARHIATSVPSPFMCNISTRGRLTPVAVVTSAIAAEAARFARPCSTLHKPLDPEEPLAGVRRGLGGSWPVDSVPTDGRRAAPADSTPGGRGRALYCSAAPFPGAETGRDEEQAWRAGGMVWG